MPSESDNPRRPYDYRGVVFSWQKPAKPLAELPPARVRKPLQWGPLFFWFVILPVYLLGIVYYLAGLAVMFADRLR